MYCIAEGIKEQMENVSVSLIVSNPKWILSFVINHFPTRRSKLVKAPIGSGCRLALALSDTCNLLFYSIHLQFFLLNHSTFFNTLFVSSRYSPKWCYAEAEETNCWIKSFCFLCAEKVFRWTILTMLFILLWTLTVQFTLQSMGQSQASRFSSKIS